MNEFSDIITQTLEYETFISKIYVGFSSIFILISFAFLLYFFKNKKIDNLGSWEIKYFVGCWFSGLSVFVGIMIFSYNMDKIIKIKMAPKYFIEQNRSN